MERCHIFLVSRQRVLSIAVNGDTVDFKETDSPKPIACKLDGTETKFPVGIDVGEAADLIR